MRRLIAMTALFAAGCASPPPPAPSWSPLAIRVIDAHPGERYTVSDLLDQAPGSSASSMRHDLVELLRDEGGSVVWNEGRLELFGEPEAHRRAVDLLGELRAHPPHRLMVDLIALEIRAEDAEAIGLPKRAPSPEIQVLVDSFTIAALIELDRGRRGRSRRYHPVYDFHESRRLRVDLEPEGAVLELRAQLLKGERIELELLAAGSIRRTRLPGDSVILVSGLFPAAPGYRRFLALRVRNLTLRPA